MKTPLRSSLPRSKKKSSEELVHSDPRIAAIILAERRELEAVRRGIFRGDVFDEQGRPLVSRPITDDEEFMRSIYPDWPDLTLEKEKT